MNFSQIPGNHAAKERLQAMALSGRLPHALLLEGPVGSCKLAMAQALAQLVHCENPTPEGEPCGCCTPCRLHRNLSHLDTYHVYPVVKRDKDREAPTSADFLTDWIERCADRPLLDDIDDWTSRMDKKAQRAVIYVTESDEVARRLSTTAQGRGSKIVIIWLPERMNEQTANKMLKLIEEPPEQTLFILVSDEPAKILPTIYSRCQRVELKRLDDAVIAQYLRDNHKVADDEANVIAHNAEGNLIAAVSALSARSDDRKFFQLFVRLMRTAYARRVGELRLWANDLAALGRDRQMKFYVYAQRMVRENFMLNFNEPQIVFLNREEADFGTRFARFISENNAVRMVREMNRAMTDIAGNGNAKIVNFDFAIRMIMLIKDA